jgi:hypothetical protein
MNLLEHDPIFKGFKLYLEMDEHRRIRMQQLIVEWYIEHHDLYDSKDQYTEIRDMLTLDLQLCWLPEEEYEICQLYNDVLKNLNDILNGKLR